MTTWRIEQPERLTLDGEVRRLDVSLVAGRLNVVGAEGPARVEVSAIGRKAVIVRQDGDTLTVEHEDLRGWPGAFWWLFRLVRRYRVDVSVAVPRDAATTVRVAAGNVVVSGLDGTVDADVTSGKVTLLGLEGRTTAKAVAGSIEALGIGGDLSLDTVSGEITLGDASAHRLRAKAISGAITCDLDNPAGSDIRLETTSGEITVRVREDSDLLVDLHATSGQVISAFPGLPASSGWHGLNHTVVGKLGAGTGKLSVVAISGQISLLRRPVERDESATS